MESKAKEATFLSTRDVDVVRDSFDFVEVFIMAKSITVRPYFLKKLTMKLGDLRAEYTFEIPIRLK